MKAKEKLTRETTCQTCPYDKRPVPYTGRKDSKIVFLGEAPATEELKQGKPFVGRSGQLLNKLLEFIGIARDDVIIANAIRCAIDNKETSKVRQGMKHCRLHLEHILLHVKPKVIVCLGAIALEQILKLKNILKLHGTFKYSEEFGCDVFITVHPAYVLRGASKDFPDIPYLQMNVREKGIIDDFKILGKYIESGYVKPDTTVSYQEVTNLDMFKNSNIISLDFETTIANYRDSNCKVLSVAVADKDKTRVLVSSKMSKSLKDLISNPNITKVVAARPFDENVSQILLKTPFKGKVYDVLTMAHLIDENSYHVFNLENIANTYTNLKDIKSVAKGFRDNLANADRETLINYNGVDADATIKAFEEMYSRLKESPEVMNYLENFMNPIQDMLSDISNNGVRVKRDLLTKTELDLTNLANSLHEESKTLINKRLLKELEGEYSLTRNEIIQQVVFLHPHGYRRKPVMFTPKTNMPQVNEAHLKIFSDVPFVAKVLEWRKIHKIISTFIPMIATSIQEDDRVYPSTILCMTKTGRSVMKNPHIQVLPARGDLAKMLKNVFEADEGWVFGSRDLSQSEIRIMGWLAKDKNMLSAIEQGIDIHTKTASIVNKVPIQEVTKDMRQKAKGINFGFLYGMLAESFQVYARTEYGLEFSLEECKEIRRAFFAKPDGYYGLPAYYQLIEKLLRERGYVKSPLGRVRRIPSVYSQNRFEVLEAIRQAINFRIQSFSSDLGFIGMYLFWKEYKKSKALRNLVKLHWFIHDNIIFSAEKHVFDDAMALLKHCMEVKSKEYIKEKFNLAVGYRIDSDAKSGTTWGNLKDYK